MSAGLLLWRRRRVDADQVEVLIVHPGGPFWANRHEGAWSIPKGEIDPDDASPLAAAKREFVEELGHSPGDAPAEPIGEVRQRGGKTVLAWAVEGDLDTTRVTSMTFELEWPPRSGRVIEVPEIDEARWVTPQEARVLLNPAQQVFVDRVCELADRTR